MPDFPLAVAETDSYLVAFKPRGMHSAPLREGEPGTLLSWCSERCPEVMSVRGRKDVERGLLHRLDRETAGLVLLAKNQVFFDFIIDCQERGQFMKEYEAVCRDDGGVSGTREVPFFIESGFRPYGPGRRAVRAVEPGRAPRRAEVALDRGEPYRTEVISIEPREGPIVAVLARLARGFRHQVRSHLSWIGLPLLGDELYGGQPGLPLGLTAVALSFPDPRGSGLIRISADQLRAGASPESRGT